ncbi:MAG: hypothetical protein WC321_06550 [Candidatus Omnitrophota bacterium]|jgi:hypothetical protein
MKRKILNLIFISFLFCFLAINLSAVSLAQGTQSREYSEAGLSQVIYSDPKGFFKIQPPANWLINGYPSDTRGKVDFNSSSASPKAQLKIIGQASPFSDFSALLTDCRNGAERMRMRFGGKIAVNEIEKFNTKVAEVRYEIPGKFKQLQIQLLIGKSYYTLAFGGPPEQFDRYEKMALKSIDTFEPLLDQPRDINPAKHIVASKIRTAEAYLSAGRKDLAMVAINEGLEVDRENEKLLELKYRCLQ